MTNQLSKLSLPSKRELFEILKTYNPKYRDVIGLGDKTTFGIEIEYVSKNAESLFVDEEKKIEIQRAIPKSEQLYNVCWQNVIENNVTTINHDEAEYGMELTSPILKDNKKSWQEIKTACEILKKHKMYINNRCGGHIHFGATQYFENDEKKIIQFFKLYALYEDILTRFGFNNLEFRQTVETCARPIADTIREKISDLEPPYCLTYVLQIFSIENPSIKITEYADFCSGIYALIPSDTIEIRSPDGTLDETRWQNNINTYGKLLQYAVGQDYDSEFVNYQYNQPPTPYSDYSLLNFDKALELADLIFETDTDKFSFLAQYIQKDTTTPQKRKQK